MGKEVRKNIRISREGNTLLELEAVYSQKDQEEIVDNLIRTHLKPKEFKFGKS